MEIPYITWEVPKYHLSVSPTGPSLTSHTGIIALSSSELWMKSM